MRRWISRFSRKEELIFIGDETLVLAARDILTKTKTDVQTSESTSSRLPVKVNHVNIPASFQPGFVVKKDGEGGGSANSLWVVLCNIDKHSEGNIPGDLVEDLCAYGKSVLWLTGMWKLYPDDTIQSTSSRPSYSSREVGGSDIDTANESSDERVASPPPVIGSSSSARAETKNNGDSDMNTYNDTNSPTPSQDDRDKSKRSSVSGPQAQSSSPIVTPFARDSSSSRDIGSSDTPYILQDKVADFADGNMNDGSSNKRTYTNPRISTTQAHGTAAPPTQRGAQDETTGGRNAHSSEYENNLTQPPHKAQSYSFETRRAFTSSPTMTPSSSPPSPIESSFETDHYTFASLRSEMGSTLSFGGAFGGGNKDYSENTPTDNDRPETSASSTIEEAEAQNQRLMAPVRTMQ
ncbi:hypothetical protein BJ165DRAFT_765753 [Panaeolus papilionaceus]|nr:hypothetical protein BJ165DRAFT_765753 [Panaeolus papilionaceus]